MSTNQEKSFLSDRFCETARNIFGRIKKNDEKRDLTVTKQKEISIFCFSRIINKELCEMN